MVSRDDIDRLVYRALGGLARWGSLRAYLWRLRAVREIRAALRPRDPRMQLLGLGLGNPVVYPAALGTVPGVEPVRLSYSFEDRLASLAVRYGGVKPYLYVLNTMRSGKCYEDVSSGYIGYAASWHYGRVVHRGGEVDAIVLVDACGARSALIYDADAARWVLYALRASGDGYETVDVINEETHDAVCDKYAHPENMCVAPVVYARLEGGGDYDWYVFEILPSDRSGYPVINRSAVAGAFNLPGYYYYDPFRHVYEEGGK